MSKDILRELEGIMNKATGCDSSCASCKATAAVLQKRVVGVEDVQDLLVEVSPDCICDERKQAEALSEKYFFLRREE